VLALRPVRIRTVAMPQMDILVCFTLTCRSTLDGGAIQQDLTPATLRSK
jgi:hypothetical protein